MSWAAARAYRSIEKDDRVSVEMAVVLLVISMQMLWSECLRSEPAIADCAVGYDADGEGYYCVDLYE